MPNFLSAHNSVLFCNFLFFGTILQDPSGTIWPLQPAYISIECNISPSWSAEGPHPRILQGAKFKVIPLHNRHVSYRSNLEVGAERENENNFHCALFIKITERIRNPYKRSYSCVCGWLIRWERWKREPGQVVPLATQAIPVNSGVSSENERFLRSTGRQWPLSLHCSAAAAMKRNTLQSTDSVIDQMVGRRQRNQLHYQQTASAACWYRDPPRHNHVTPSTCYNVVRQ